MNAEDEAQVERLIAGRGPITDPRVLHRVAALLETRNEAPAQTDASPTTSDSTGKVRGGTRAA